MAVTRPDLLLQGASYLATLRRHKVPLLYSHVLTRVDGVDRAQRAARTGRNPQTGETIKIKASKSPKVSAGASFKKVVNGQAPAPKLAKAK